MTSERQIRIGFGPRDYIAFRAFQRVPVPGATFIREPYLPIRRLNSLHQKLKETVGGVGLFVPTGRVDLHHSLNTIPLNQSPWIVTFECQLPRVWNAPRLSSFLLRRAASSSCRQVIAMSENAKFHLINRNRNDPSLKAVLEKTSVIHASLEDDPKAFETRKRRDQVPSFHLVFVGNEFFRKGGHFAVEAFERLQNSYPIKLTVVSSLSPVNDFFPVSPQLVMNWRKRMDSAGVTLRQGLSTREIRELLSTADLLLLPTLEDSFGFSMIEAMATGVAVVATAVEAVPEIVENGTTGMLLDVPVTEEKRMIWSEDVGRKIVDQLVNTLEHLFQQPEQLYEMGMQGRERYEKHFRPDIVGNKLAEVYRRALE